jgi:phosphoribosyl 1,2-cyclic phosphate phosphodiesterase
MQGRLKFLGTGTSMGVPTLGCDCAVCLSDNPRDRRLRPSVLLRWDSGEGLGRERVLLIDTGPDFREQALRERLTFIDAVFYTHAHADHILGFDDLRPLSFLSYHAGGPIPLFADAETAATLERIYDYTLAPTATYANRARVEIRPLCDRNEVYGIEVIRVPVMHGDLEISGFRFGDTAYLTDVSAIPESSFSLLEGVETLVLPALRHTPHPNHANVEQAVSWARRIGARQTWFTHICHDLGHEETNRMLPEGVALAHDGLEVTVNLAGTSQPA